MTARDWPVRECPNGCGFSTANTFARMDHGASCPRETLSHAHAQRLAELRGAAVEAAKHRVAIEEQLRETVLTRRGSECLWLFEARDDAEKREHAAVRALRDEEAK